MTSTDSIDVVTISLEIDGTPSLFILLANDGSINRMGPGSVHNTEHDMYIGVIDNKPFQKVRAKIPADWLDQSGRFEQPNRMGPECELTIGLRRTDGEDVIIQILYGAESEGPPEDVVDFVSTAVDLTANWTRKQKALAEKADGEKPWWKFW